MNNINSVGMGVRKKINVKDFSNGQDDSPFDIVFFSYINLK